MSMTTMKAKTTLAVALMAMALFLLAACGSQAGSSASQDASSASGSAEASDATAEKAAQYEKALSANGLVTSFIGEQFYDKAIESDDDAAAAVESVISRIGGDDTTKLDLSEIRPTETGTTYYTFRQQAGDITVHGASVKLVTDKDNKAIGLVSAIMPDVQLPDLDSWEVTQEQAEQAVLDACAADGHESVEVVAGASEQTLIALEDNSDDRRYAWVVYTDNYLPDSDAAYLAHYVSADGEYIYGIPVAEPGNADSLAGDAAAFAFDKMEQGTWTGTVTKHDGTTTEVTVPTLTNPDTGAVMLGDGTRKIICADFADFEFGETISPRVQTDGEFADNEVLIYDTFIRVWDFYDSIGWTGPDGEGTPSILLMDMVYEDGTVNQNANYKGRMWGFQAFGFNRIDPDGECYDIVAHEFTHCVTTTTMTINLYRNDTGAINEGMSDILGNLIEMKVAYDPDGAWIIGENEGETGPYRSMKDPRAYRQPEYAWDMFYGPAVAAPSDDNDYGGVHNKSSMLNLVSYKLDQAGMSVEDQFYFWMNVALALTPSTDYPQMAELLPWVMQQSGYPQYVDAVKASVEAGRFTTTVMPETPPAGAGFVKLSLPDEAVTPADDAVLYLSPVVDGEEGESIPAWAEAGSNGIIAAVPAGDYVAQLQAGSGESAQALLLTEDGWVGKEGAGEPVLIAVAEGGTTDLPVTGLGR